MNKELSELELLYPELFKVLDRHSEIVKKITKLINLEIYVVFSLLSYFVFNHLLINLSFIFSIISKTELNTILEKFIFVVYLELFLLISSFLLVIKKNETIKIKEEIFNLWIGILSFLLFIFLLQALGLVFPIDKSFTSIALSHSHVFVVVLVLILFYSIILFYKERLIKSLEKKFDDKFLRNTFTENEYKIINPTCFI